MKKFKDVNTHIKYNKSSEIHNPNTKKPLVKNRKNIMIENDILWNNNGLDTLTFNNGILGPLVSPEKGCTLIIQAKFGKVKPIVMSFHYLCTKLEILKKFTYGLGVTLYLEKFGP